MMIWTNGRSAKDRFCIEATLTLTFGRYEHSRLDPTAGDLKPSCISSNQLKKPFEIDQLRKNE
jgi:hypothetical protein